jgi:hypothetical protein
MRSAGARFSRSSRTAAGGDLSLANLPRRCILARCADIFDPHPDPERAVTTHPPRWDLTAWFADFGAAFDRALDRCAQALAEIDAAAAALGPLDAARIERWSALLVDFEAVTTDLQHAGAYAGARSAADAEDAAAIAATARIAAITAIAEGIEARIVTALGAADPAVFAALATRPALAGAGYRLDRWRERAKRAMHPDAERLAADLAVHGLHSWARLYRQVTSAMTFEADGETVPLAWLRGELEGGDPKRRAAGALPAPAGPSPPNRRSSPPPSTASPAPASPSTAAAACATRSTKPSSNRRSTARPSTR